MMTTGVSPDRKLITTSKAKWLQSYPDYWTSLNFSPVWNAWCLIKLQIKIGTYWKESFLRDYGIGERKNNFEARNKGARKQKYWFLSPRKCVCYIRRFSYLFFQTFQLTPTACKDRWCFRKIIIKIYREFVLKFSFITWHTFNS